MLFDKLCTVEVRTASGVYNNFVWIPHAAYASGVWMNIQPMQTQFTNTGDGLYFKNYKAFTTASGIVEGYRLTVSGTGEQYIVNGRQRFDYIVAPHYELMLEADKQ